MEEKEYGVLKCHNCDDADTNYRIEIELRKYINGYSVSATKIHDHNTARDDILVSVHTEGTKKGRKKAEMIYGIMLHGIDRA